MHVTDKRLQIQVRVHHRRRHPAAAKLELEAMAEMVATAVPAAE